jgi:1-acyl-sn-glycerol-3-phosphate acyltransferase
MMERIAFTLRAAASLGVMTIGALVMLACALATGFGARRFYREAIGARIGRAILAIWGVRYVVHGAPHAAGRQTVYISNHTSTIDMFVLIALAMPDTRFFLSGFLRKLLPLGLIGYLIGVFWTVPQDFPERRREIFRRAGETLKRTGESVYLSPEGERITSGEIGPFNKGAFHLATVLRAPIVPMYIAVPPEANPGKGLHAKPGVVHVHFGDPIETSAWRVEDAPANRDHMHGYYVRWHDALRQA